MLLLLELQIMDLTAIFLRFRLAFIYHRQEDEKFMNDVFLITNVGIM